MSNKDDDLVLHLELDNIDTRNNTTSDSSKSGLKAEVHGADLAEDDTFGACLNFDEQDDYVEVSSLALPGQNPPHTIEGWIKVKTYPEKEKSFILLFGQTDHHSHHWLLNSGTAGNLGKKAQLGHWGLGHDAKPIIPTAQWVHLAATFDGSDYVCYLNGQSIEFDDKRLSKSYKFTMTDKRLTLAGHAKLRATAQSRGIATEQNFQGKMAHVRVYRRALSESEIREDMSTDKLALPAYRKGHPIAFSLRDRDENYVLYIGDDPRDHHRLNLELQNTSAQDIGFQKKGDTASIENHHFKLIFRNGVLSEKTLTKLRENKEEVIASQDAKESWDLFCPPREESQTSTISVYLLYKGTSKLFGHNTSLFIPLRNISADAGSGARGTRVELKLNQLTYDGETVPITGNRIQHLQIISHLGNRRVPLHVGFVGSNRILNDGSPDNTLVLQLMNVLKSEGDTSVPSDTTVTLKKDSEFRITFDVQSNVEVAPWSLCTEDEVKELRTENSIIVAKTDSAGKVIIGQDGKPESDTGRWQVTPDHDQGQSPVWKIVPKQEIPWKQDDYILIYISNIKTSLPSGLTNLYLDYKGIPGFWQGQVVCPIEKAPLLFYDVTYSDSQALQNGIADLKKLRQGFEQGRAAALAISDTIAVARFDADLATIAPEENRLAQLQNQPQKHTGELRVGIGCVKPQAKLEIALSAKDADTKPLVIRGSGKDRVNYLTVLHDGKVGIGTPSPQNQLHIGPGSSSIAPDRVNVVVASESSDAGVAIAQKDGVNVFLQASGGGGYLGTNSNHPLVLRANNQDRIVVFPNAKVVVQPGDPAGAKVLLQGTTDGGFLGTISSHSLLLKTNDQDRIVVDANGKVGIGTRSPGAKLSIMGGLHVGGESDPGDKNLLVGGKASIREGLYVGAPLIDGVDGALSVGSGSSLLVNGSGFFLGALLLRNSIGFLNTRTSNFAAEIAVEPALVFKTYHGGKWYNSVTIRPPGGDMPTLDVAGSTLDVAGSIYEKVDIITGSTDWTKPNSEIMKYFRKRLKDKPKGTMLRAIAANWPGHFWQGWVDHKGDIPVIPILYSSWHYALQQGAVYAD
jgi:Concanavalin A-like lectin/glucanases superfamily